MKVEYLFLADAGMAQRESGLFTVLNGGINLVRCPKFPGGLHSVFLLGRISFDPDESAEKHWVDAEIVSPGGQILEPAFRGLELSPGQSELGADKRPELTLALTFQSIVFPNAGTFAFRILKSGTTEELGRTTIEVLPLEV